MKRNLYPALAALAASLATVGAARADLSLFALKTIDLTATSDATNASYIGSNPSAVAWNGTDLFVAGFNSSGAAANTGVVRIADALNAATFGTTFGAVSTPNLRGVSGLVASGGTVVATFDNGGASADGLRAFDSSGSNLWSVNLRGIAGAAIDPGFGGSAATVSALTINSGRRARFNLTTGAVVNDFTNGAIINFDPSMTIWRDHAYDPATGDLYSRVSNQVGRIARTGDNNFSGPQTRIATTPDLPFTAGTNIAFLNGPGGKTVLFNDRVATGDGQSFTSIVKAVSPTGGAMAINLNGFTFADGNGYYDFSYDAASGTLAVMDFANRSATIFSTSQPVPEPASMAALALGAAALLRRRKRA